MFSGPKNRRPQKCAIRTDVRHLSSSWEKKNTKAPKFVFDNYLVYVNLKVAKEHLV